MRLELKGLTAWICCGDEELESYAAETSKDEKEMSCWIASEVGKTFSIHWTKSSQHSGEYSGQVYLDGIGYGGMRMKQGDPNNTAYHKRGWWTSDTTVRPFVFANLELTDNVVTTGVRAELGQICLSIMQFEPHSAVRTDYGKPPVVGIIGEQIKGAISHRAQVAIDAIQVQSSGSVYEVTYLDKEPVVRFVFKYRSIDVLKAKGIVPLDVSQNTPIPVASEITVKDETTVSDADVNPQSPSRASAEPQPHAKSVVVKDEEMNQINQIGSLAITASPSNPASPLTRAGQKRRASADPKREHISDEGGNDAAQLAALDEEAQALRSKIIKAKIKARKADVQALRAELEALTGGSGGSSADPSVKRVKKEDTPQPNNTSPGPKVIDLT